MDIGGCAYSARTIMNEIHEEFVCDYLTVEKWAEHNEMTVSDAECLLHFAKRIYQSNHPEE